MHSRIFPGLSTSISMHPPARLSVPRSSSCASHKHHTSLTQASHTPHKRLTQAPHPVCLTEASHKARHNLSMHAAIHRSRQSVPLGFTLISHASHKRSQTHGLTRITQEARPWIVQETVQETACETDCVQETACEPDCGLYSQSHKRPVCVQLPHMYHTGDPTVDCTLTQAQYTRGWHRHNAQADISHTSVHPHTTHTYSRALADTRTHARASKTE